ncbi:MAG TPA: FtsX-like permease family protein [Candidatus Limnocylindrales bacterium]
MVRLATVVLAVLRRLRAERTMVAALFVLVAVTSLAVALVPRLFERVADDALRYAVGRGTAIQRNFQFTSVDRVRAGSSDPLEFVHGRGEVLSDRFPPTIQGVVGGRHAVVESPRFGLVDPPNYPSFVTLRYQDAVADRLTMRAGRPPVALPVTEGDVPQRFEIALSSATAAELLVEVGDVLDATVDPSDPMVQPLFPRPTADVVLEVVGLFDVTDPRDPAWFDDPAYSVAEVGGSDDAPIAFATALFAPEAYPALADLGLPSRYRWRFEVDPARLDTGMLEAFVADVRRLDTTYGTNRGGFGRVVYRSGLLEILDRYADQRASTEAVLSVAALGPLAVAAGALGLVAVIIIRRRRVALALSRGRGASPGQLLAAQLWEGLLITVPAAIAGLATAAVAVPARSGAVSAAGVALVAIAVTTLLLLATWPRARLARRELDRDDAAARRPAPRRLVFEVTLVAGAIAATWLLRERGFGAARDGDGATSFDPFLAAAPVLIGVATALLTLRLYPLPIRLVAWLTARRRDLVPTLGFRTIGRDPSAAYLPLLVVTLTVAIGVFSSVLGLSIERAQVAASWQDVGGDYRISAAGPGGLDEEVDPARIAGVDAVTRALVGPVSRFIDDRERGSPATLMAVDPATSASVLGESPVPVSFPVPFADPPTGPDTGTPEQPIPAAISPRLPAGWPPLTIGETFRGGFRGQVFDFVVVGRLDAMPGIPRTAPVVVVPLPSVEAGWTGPTPRATALFVRGPASVGADLRSAFASPSVEVTSRHDLLAGIRDAPLIGAISRGFAVALVAAGVYAALSIAATITLDAERRSRELAYLRTLGLSGRQSVSLTFVEHAPPTTLALGIGVLLGLVVAWLLEPGLGLGSFVGSAAAVRLEIDWPAVTAIALTVVGVVVLMVVASSWLARRLEPALALRMGDA